MTKFEKKFFVEKNTQKKEIFLLPLFEFLIKSQKLLFKKFKNKTFNKDFCNEIFNKPALVEDFFRDMKFMILSGFFIICF